MDNVGSIIKGAVISMGGTGSLTNIDYRLYNNFIAPYSNFTQFFFGGQIT